MGLKEIVSLSRLEEILNNITQVKIGIVGDMALDAYWYADLTKSLLSRETPRFPRPVIREDYAPGAGANVAQNLKSIGVGEVFGFGIFGKDWRGEILDRELTIRGVQTEKIVKSSSRTTSTYIKPILMGFESQQEDSRIDFENANPLPCDVEDQLLEILTTEIPQLDGLYIADQFEQNGVITNRIRSTLISLAGKFDGKFFMVDSRKRIGLFENMLLKPNWVEASRAVYANKDPREYNFKELEEIGKLLSTRCCRPVYITVSDKGVLVCDESDQTHIMAAPVTPPLDPVGAGDAFGSAVLAALTAGATKEEAGVLGCLAASVTVEKLNQTGTATPEEIHQRYQLAQRKS